MGVVMTRRSMVKQFSSVNWCIYDISIQYCSDDKWLQRVDIGVIWCPEDGQTPVGGLYCLAHV